MADTVATAMLAGLPFVFVQNQGQWDTPAKFVARRAGMIARFEKESITLQLARRDGDRQQGVIVRLAFDGTLATVALEGQGEQAGRYNFFLGSDPAKWRTGVRGYSNVLYRGLQDGVDLRVRGHEGRIEYDAILAPRADLHGVVVRCEGTQGIEIEPDGSLIMKTALGPIRHTRPVAWQILSDGEHSPIEARFRIVASNRFGFEAPGSDPALALVIDPGLVYSTFLGGATGDYAVALAVDASGAATVTGFTNSPDFPTTPGAYDRTFNSSGGPEDVFVCRLSPSGSSLVYSTFLGGASMDVARALALDASGTATLTGSTYATDFPVTVGAYDTIYNGGGDAFVTRLSPSGGSLVYSTFLGGASDDAAHAIALDTSGAATVGGSTQSTDFPTTVAAYDTSYNGRGDGFVTRLSPSGGSLVYSTFLGGTDYDYALTLAVDAIGASTVAGETYAADFPTTVGAYDASFNGGIDAFVTRLSASGGSLIYSTFLGGTNSDYALTVAVDAIGASTVAGSTSSPDFPTTAGAYDPSHNGNTDAFVTRLSASGASLVYSTFLGGDNYDHAHALALDASGGAVVVGRTESWDFPATPGAFQIFYYRGGGWPTPDAFVARLSSSGGRLLYSTFLGGVARDVAATVALAATGEAIVAGGTGSTFPTTVGAFDTSFNGGSLDAFVTKLDLLPTGASAYGVSTAGCTGPLAIGVTSWPRVGNGSFALTCSRAPSQAIGLLGISAAGLAAAFRVLGADVWIDLASPGLFVPAASNAMGVAEVSLPVPAAVGGRVYAQFFWLGPTSPSPCPPLGLSASNALAMTVQP